MWDSSFTVKVYPFQALNNHGSVIMQHDDMPYEAHRSPILVSVVV